MMPISQLLWRSACFRRRRTNGQGKLGETEEGVFDALTDVHFKGVYVLMQQLLPQIAGVGAIVRVSSGLSPITIWGYGPHAAVKSAVQMT